MHPNAPSSVAIDPSLTVPQQLKAVRTGRGKTLVDLAKATGLSRLTVSAAEGMTDARISSLAALFDALGYTLLAVPKPLAREVANFINNGGVSVSLPAGHSAPLGVGQRAFQAREFGLAIDDDELTGK